MGTGAPGEAFTNLLSYAGWGKTASQLNASAKRTRKEMLGKCFRVAEMLRTTFTGLQQWRNSLLLSARTAEVNPAAELPSP